MTYFRRSSIKRKAPLKRSTSRIPRGARPRSSVPSRTGTRRSKESYANNLWRYLIYAKSPTGICLRCYKRPKHDAMHSFPKGRYRHLRFELDNGLPGCRSCHTIIDSDHLAKEDLFRKHLGDKKYAALELRARSRSKLDIDATIMFLERETARCSPPLPPAS